MLHLSHLCPFTPYRVGGGGSERGGLVGWNTRGKATRLTPSKETCRLSKKTCRLIFFIPILVLWKIIWVILAIFVHFECKCQIILDIANILQNAKGYFFFPQKLLTINEPFVNMAWDVMILMGENQNFESHWRDEP
jgi:hypothetical protein